ncbi:unnamed protein product [Rotaria sp. Silwood2]|nr:unnamed protein product [Rotaria sp. Silwood2]
MRNRHINIRGHTLIVSRQIPRKIHLSHQITCGLKVEISSNSINSNETLQIDVTKYFQQYGKINYYEYMGNNKVYFIFDDYDIVDRIMLEKTQHTYKGFSLTIEKVRLPDDRRTIIGSDVTEYCIHVTNMPTNVTGEDLSRIFRVDIANILIRPYNELNDHLVEDNRTQVEAWIKEIGSEQSAQKLAGEKNGFYLRGFKIQCQVIRVPLKIFELCRHFQQGTCSYSICCEMKHIRCVQPVTCENNQCWYGHDSERITKSIRRPTSRDDCYRVRIANFPPNATRPEIFKRLQVNSARIQENLILCNESSSTEPIIAYVIDQKSEIIVKKLIHSWHNQLFSTDQPYRMKCQLEINVEYFNSTIGISISLTPQIQSRTPSIISSTDSMKVRKATTRLDLQNRFAQLKIMSNIDHNEDDQSYSNIELMNEVNIIELPSSWDWENATLLKGRINETSRVYLVSDQTDRNKQAEIRIYSTMSDRTSRLRIQRHRIVLERLKEIDGVPKLIDCNYDTLTNNSKISTKLWIITEAIEGITLDQYVAGNEPKFPEIINIILLLINLVKDIHEQNVVHRNLTPRNIFIHRTNSIEGDQFHLKLINFDLAHIDEKKINSKNQNIWSRDNNQLKNDFYQMPQFEVKPLNNNDIDDEIQQIDSERQSKTIDATFICALLFWMITLHEPKDSRNIDRKAPHELNEHIQLIQHELKRVAVRNSRKFHSLWRHLTLIFDRGFAKPQLQWSINELQHQIQLIFELITNMKNYDDSIQQSLTASMVSNELFIRLASFINIIKHHFVTHCVWFDSIHWSLNENNRWSGNNQIIHNDDILIVGEHELPIKLNIIRLENEKNLKICMEIKMNEMNTVELPFDVWREDEIENELGTIMNIFIMEFMNFYNAFIE